MRYVIFGAGNFGTQAIDLIGKSNIEFFIDNNVNIEKDITLLGYPVESKPYNKEISEMPKEIYCIPYLQNPFHITSGYFNFFEMILQRKKIYHAKRQKF